MLSPSTRYFIVAVLTSTLSLFAAADAECRQANMRGMLLETEEMLTNVPRLSHEAARKLAGPYGAPPSVDLSAHLPVLS